MCGHSHFVNIRIHHSVLLLLQLISVFQILQLYSSLSLGQGVILAGLSGYGKTTMYRLLARVLTRLNVQQTDTKAKVDEEFAPERSMAQQHSTKLKVGWSVGVKCRGEDIYCGDRASEVL